MEIEAELFGKNSDAREIALIAVRAQAEAEKLIAKLVKEGNGPTQEQTDAIRDNADARARAAQAAAAQSKAFAYVNQLTEDNKRFAAESIADEQSRAEALLQIDADLWRQRISNAGEGTKAQKMLQEQFDVWYANRQMAPVLDRWKNIIGNLDNDFREGFRDMLTHGKSAWSSFSKALGNTLKTSLADALYQTFIKKYVVQIVASLAGVFSGPTLAATLSGQAGSPLGSTASLLSAGKSLWDGFSSGFSSLGSTAGQLVSSFGNSIGSNSVFSFGQGMQGYSAGGVGSGINPAFASAGNMASVAVSYAASVAIGKMVSTAISDGYKVNHGNALNNIGSLGGVIGSTITGLHKIIYTLVEPPDWRK